MMNGVAGQWNMEMSIGGRPYPANTTNVTDFYWFESIHQNLPSVNFKIRDVDGTFTPIALAGDGIPVEVTLGDGGRNGESSARFNIQGRPQVSHGPGYNIIKINAVLDAMPYMRSIATGFMEGSSANVLSQLASKAGLKFNGVSTADAMVWLPNNKTIGSFVRDVAARGWVGQGSCLVSAVTSDFELIYRNIMSPPTGPDTFGINSRIPILDWEATSNAMVTNNNRGYGSTAVGYGMDGVLQELNKVTFNMFSGFLSLSAANITSVGTLGGRIDSIIRSAGNTHDKYEEAKHQNARIRDTFSSDLNILIDMHSTAKLLDKVMATPPDYTTQKPNSALTGPYIVTARTRALTRSKYNERLTLTSQGSN